MLPKPARHATYPHDHTDGVGQLLGPDTTGAFVTAVEATYDAASDTTRLGFAYGIHRGVANGGGAA